MIVECRQKPASLHDHIKGRHNTEGCLRSMNDAAEIIRGTSSSLPGVSLWRGLAFPGVLCLPVILTHEDAGVDDENQRTDQNFLISTELPNLH